MVTNDVEFYSFHRAQRSIRRSDVVMMLVDAMEAISEPDKKLAQYIVEQYKPVIIVVNKWDLARQAAREQREEAVDDTTLMEEYRVYLEQELPNLNYAPIAFVTAKDEKNVQVALDLAQHLAKQTHTRLSTGQLNKVLEQILQERCPSAGVSGRRVKIFYATQTAVNPPTIVLFVNHPKDVTESYKRYIINRFRELLPYAEVPIRLMIRGRGNKEGNPEKDD
jgi:GTPase